jgi:NAD+ diphosphatase
MHRESIYKHYTPAVIAEHEANCCSYWFVFFSDKLLIEANETENKVHIPFVKTLEELSMCAVRTQYLGALKGHPCYSAEVEAVDKLPEGMCFRDLRSLYGSIEEDIFLLAGRASQLVNWDKSHQYCGRCGSETETLQGDRAKKCPKCGLLNYPTIAPAIITAIIKDNKILLAHNKAFRGNMHSLIAGFVEPGETLEECVEREVMEEVGIKVKDIKYWGSQPWPFPNSLMLGFTAQYESGEIKEDGTEIVSADWFDANNLPELPSQISIARKIIDWYLCNYKTT